VGEISRNSTKGTGAIVTPTPISFAIAQSIDPPHRFAGGGKRKTALRGVGKTNPIALLKSPAISRSIHPLTRARSRE
jgi:hypothetical protein